jgi:hypothetical protein
LTTASAENFNTDVFWQKRGQGRFGIGKVLPGNVAGLDE